MLAVAGTHGKTTTSSMLAWILEHAGLAPGFLIGGVPLNFGVSARLTDSGFFVIEADEYDTAFFDKRSKFVHYRPRTAILNNLEFDHADIFPDLAAIETQFHHLVRTRAAARAAWSSTAARTSLARVLARGAWSEVERFAPRDVPGTGPDWRIDGDGAVELGGAPQGTLVLDAPGRHNQLNALAALAAARHVGVPVDVGLAGARALPRRQAPDGSARHRRRRHRLRRLRAPSDGDRDDGRRAAPARGRRAHPRRARAALEHDEARHDEGRAAREPRAGGSRVLLRAQARLGRRRGARAARRARERARRPRRARRRGQRGGARRRPRARHEQRRLRRRARQAPRAPRRRAAPAR